jgi:crotonobetainyl-CoA:carnitine CoA-transferase CaiB-like acyl-CoA transferase
MSSILEGVLVLDFSEYIAGPYCGCLLGDLGAEVIKIEPPDGGEERRLGNQKRYRGNTRMTLTLNRGKKGICIDLTKDEGRQIVYRMAEKADIIIQNFAPGIAEKLGIDYETLSKINEQIIFISSTAFGEIGPYRQRKGFDIIAHAASGIMSFFANEDGNPKGPGGAPFIDVSTGMLNAFGAVSALLYRMKTGKGQKIETSLFNTGMALMTTGFALIEELDKERHQKELEILRTAHQKGMKHTQIIDELAEMRLRFDQPDTARPIEVPDCNHRPTDRLVYPYYRVYQTSNGYIGIAALNPKQRQTLCEVIGINDEGVNVNIGNISDKIYFHQKDVMKKIENKLTQKTNEEWIQALEDAGIPCGPVNYHANLFYDKQAEAVNMIWELENTEIGTYKMAGHPIRYLKTPAKQGKGAPTLGEDTVDVLKQFGFNESEINTFKESSVIKQHG